MSNGLMKLRMVLDIDGDKAVVTGLERVKTSTEKVSHSTGRMATESDKAAGGLGRMGSSLLSLGGVMAGLAFAALARDILRVNTEFDRLQASLVTVTGSTRAADVAFADIQAFAKTTPYQLSEVTDAFIKMRSLGLDASMQALKSYGNTASAMGKSLNQMIEAVADASTGEFERLKEFGIKARQQGDQVSLTFQGVTTTIGNSAADIEGYLRQIGELQFAGGMDRQMETLGGKLSNLADSWDAFIRTIGDSGVTEAAKSAIEALTAEFERLGTALKLYSAYADGSISLFEYATMGADEAFEFFKTTDLELRKLQTTYDALRAHKSGNFWWSEDEEAQLQAAKHALDGYKLNLEAVAKLEKARAINETANMPPLPPPVAAPQVTQAALDKELKMLQAANRERYAGAVESAKKMEDLWLTEAARRADAEIRGINMVSEQRAADAEAAQEQITESAKGMTDYWLVAAQGAEAANERAKDYAATLGTIKGSFQDNTKELLKGLSISQKAFDQDSAGYAAIGIAIQAVNTARAIGAVLNQGSGDPYTAFARMAAMAAAVASLGQSVGSFGGGFADTAANRQATQGTGSVLGDASAKSDAIAQATEITADATSELVGINRNMLTALQNLQSGINGAVTLIARGASGASLTGGADIAAATGRRNGVINAILNPALSLMNKGVDLLGDNILGDIGKFALALPNALMGWITKTFIGGSSKVTDEGVRIIGGYITDLIDDTTSLAYQKVSSKKYKWSKTKHRDFSTGLGDAVDQQFQLVFAGIADSVSAGAEALGLSAQEINAAIAAFEIDTISISLKGLDPAEQQAELEAVFGKIFDGLAGSVVPFIDDFVQAGESYGQTLARVATNVQVTEAAIKRLGFSMSIPLSWIDKLLSVLIDGYTPSAEKMARLTATAATALVEAAGGMEQFIDSMQGFFSNFAPEALQFSTLSNDLSFALGEAGLKLPKTRDGMWDLMQTLDAGTESGREQIATLLRLQDTADQYYTQSEKLAAERERVASERYALETQLLQAQGDTAALRARELEQIDPSNQALRQTIWALQDQQAAAAAGAAAQQEAERAQLAAQEAARKAAEDVANAWRDAAADIRDTILGLWSGSDSSLSNTQKLALAQQQYESTLAGARGGDIDAAKNLSSVARDYASTARDNVGSSLEYARIFSRITSELTTLASRIDPLPGFASGGYHTGGLRIVGENGPELEYTGPSRIFSNNQSRQMLGGDNRELISEIKQLKGYLKQTTKNTGETRDRLNRWNANGIPEERVAV